MRKPCASSSTPADVKNFRIFWIEASSRIDKNHFGIPVLGYDLPLTAALGFFLDEFVLSIIVGIHIERGYDTFKLFRVDHRRFPGIVERTLRRIAVLQIIERRTCGCSLQELVECGDRFRFFGHVEKDHSGKREEYGKSEHLEDYKPLSIQTQTNSFLDSHQPASCQDRNRGERLNGIPFMPGYCQRQRNQAGCDPDEKQPEVFSRAGALRKQIAERQDRQGVINHQDVCEKADHRDGLVAGSLGEEVVRDVEFQVVLHECLRVSSPYCKMPGEGDG